MRTHAQNLWLLAALAVGSFTRAEGHSEPVNPVGLEEPFPTMPLRPGDRRAVGVGVAETVAGLYFIQAGGRMPNPRGPVLKALDKFREPDGPRLTADRAALEMLDDATLRVLAKPENLLEEMLIRAGLTAEEALGLAKAARTMESSEASAASISQLLKNALGAADNQALAALNADTTIIADVHLFDTVAGMTGKELLSDARSGALRKSLQKIGMSFDGADKVQRLVLARKGSLVFMNFQRLLGAAVLADAALKGYYVFRDGHPGALPLETLADFTKRKTPALKERVGDFYLDEIEPRLPKP